MRISDYIEQSFRNLWRRKLRTFLTTFGVAIGIGALVSMISFGEGIQKNITDRFNALELFNYVNVMPAGEQRNDFRTRRAASQANRQKSDQNEPAAPAPQPPVLDDELIKRITQIEGVESAFPEIRFPAVVRSDGEERFTFVQALPVYVYQSSLKKLRAGTGYASEDENSAVVGDGVLRAMGIKDPQEAIGRQITIRTLTFDPNTFNPVAIASILQGRASPFASESYTFTIVGVTEHGGMGGWGILRSDVLIPVGVASKMKKVSLTSIGDLFRPPGERAGYSAVSVRVSSVKYVESVRKRLDEMGLRTFAFIDELEEFRKGFIFMDLFLFAVGMIAITVACLGIVNTMVMSILERYREIGIMKAVGAGDADVKKIFFFEAGIVGFLGGVFGCALGWAVSMVINLVANVVLARQGVPYVDYFGFPWWLPVGAIAFSILVSLAAGVYPARRAARVDPVAALRHD